ncbi:MAG: hypothetical protein QME92_01380 [Bacillota bacterium]|nr:hypothetical protein [Bacillota bacterium]
MEDRDLPGLSEHDTAIYDTPSGPVVTASGQQMIFRRGDDGRLRFTTRVHDGAGWTVVAGLPNVLVGGASFDLAPSSYTIPPSRGDRRQAVLFSGTGTGCVPKNAATLRNPEYCARDAEGLCDVEKVQYPFDAEVSVTPGDPWIHVSVAVHLERPLVLQPSPSIEPEIVLWMSEYATMNERQNHEWRRVVISNPTRNCTGVRGNDFPAVYCYDPVRRAEVVLYFDMTCMTWMSRANLARFEDCLCSSKLDGARKERFGVGLWADHYHGRIFPAGDHVFRYSIYQRHRQDIPSQWDALATLIDSTSLLLGGDEKPELGPRSQERRSGHVPHGSWAEVAGAALDELMHDPACQTEVEGVWGHPAYVRSSSRQWAEPRSFELMTQADVLWPLLHYARASEPGRSAAASEEAAAPVRRGEPASCLQYPCEGDPGPDASRGVSASPDSAVTEYLRRLTATLPHFFREDIGFIGNNYPHTRGQEKVDTWYFFENGLIKWPWIVHLLEMSQAAQKTHERAVQQAAQQMPPSPCALHAPHAPRAPHTPNTPQTWQAPQASQILQESHRLAPPAADTAKLADMFMTAFEGARRYAHNVRHVFPLFYDPATGMPVDSGTNYSVAGLYAYGAVLAFRLSGREEFLGEARDALLTMTRLPLDLLYHEPQQFAFGALAAFELSSLLGDPSLARISHDLIRAELRMLYWYDDLARSRGAYHTRGLFQACASILYPAFKENVESVLPWLPLLKEGGFNPALLRVLDLQRRNNFYHFDPFLPESERTGAVCPHIPYENIGTLELPDSTGYVGKEIYGAGEVLWLYLMFEAFARASDPSITTVYLDLLDWDRPFMDEDAPRSVLVYNPTSTRFEGTVDLASAAHLRRPWRVEAACLGKDGRWEAARTQAASGGSVDVALDPGECCKLVVLPEDRGNSMRAV